MASDKAITSPAQAYRLYFASFKGARQEHCSLLCLDTRGSAISHEIVSIGTLNASLMHPRDVFYPAIVKNAASVIVAHNHPSGDTTPSPEDLEVTARLVSAGRILGIAVSDHIIVAAGGYSSLRELGHIT